MPEKSRRLTRPDKAFITYANEETEVMQEGETAKELNYEREDMQAAVLRKTDGHQSDNVREQ